MDEKRPICKKCNSQCKEQIHADPTWFGRWLGDKLMEAICIDCWNKGEKWDNSSLKK
jgi:hypothetical protein